MTGIANERFWNPERVELLTKLWSEPGMTSEDISRQMPGTTRNSVIGKAHRIGLPKKGPSPYKARPKRRVKKEGVVIEKRKPAPFQEPNGALIPFIRAGLTTCRSIEGRGDSDGHNLAMFCSNPKNPEDSFCPYHIRQYYNGGGR